MANEPEVKVSTGTATHMNEAAQRARAQLGELKATEATAKEAAAKAAADRALAEDRIREQARSERDAVAAKQQADAKHKADLASAHKKLDAAKAEFNAAKESAGTLADKGASAAKLADAENKYIKATQGVQVQQEKVDALHRNTPEAQAKHEARQQAKAGMPEQKPAFKPTPEEKAARLETVKEARAARAAGEGERPLAQLEAKKAEIDNARNAAANKPPGEPKPTAPSVKTIGVTAAAGALVAGGWTLSQGGSTRDVVGAAIGTGAGAGVGGAISRFGTSLLGKGIYGTLGGIAAIGVGLGINKLFASDSQAPGDENPHPAPSPAAASGAPVPAAIPASGASVSQAPAAADLARKNTAAEFDRVYAKQEFTKAKADLRKASAPYAKSSTLSDADLSTFNAAKEKYIAARAESLKVHGMPAENANQVKEAVEWNKAEGIEAAKAAGRAPAPTAPAPVGAGKPAAAAKPAAAPAATSADGKIIVQPGDSLSAISRDHDLMKEARKQAVAAIGKDDPLTVHLVLAMTLAKVNDIKNPDKIYPMKPLEVPTKDQINEMAGIMIKTKAMVDDGKISGQEYKELMKGKTIDEVLAPAPTPGNRPEPQPGTRPSK